jgi:hypothetical protein
MKTKSLPLRGSTQIAVRTIVSADCPNAGGCAAGSMSWARSSRSTPPNRAGRDVARVFSKTRAELRRCRAQTAAAPAADHADPPSDPARSVGIVGGFDPRLRIERQAQSDRRIPRHEIAALGTQEPRAGFPAFLRRFERQHMADDLVESLLEHLGQPLRAPPCPSGSIGADRRSPAATLAPEVVKRVLIRRHDPFAAAAETLGQRVDESRRVGFVHAVVRLHVGKQMRMRPHGWPSLRQ